MSGNRGRACVPAPVVEDLLSATIARMTSRHPAFDVTTVNAVAYQAAVELVSTVADPTQLRLMLERRVMPA